jgi:hypothetical protein
MSLSEAAGNLHSSREQLTTAAIEHLVPARNQLADAANELIRTIGRDTSHPLFETSRQLYEVVKAMDMQLGTTANYWQTIGRFLVSLDYADSDPEAIQTGFTQLETSTAATVAAEVQKSSPSPFLADSTQAHRLPSVPLLRDIMRDESRKNSPLFHRAFYQDKVTVTTEYDAANELGKVLEDYTHGEEPDSSDVKVTAEQLLQHHNFIGLRELDGACQAVGKDWQDYLQQNPDAQICLVPGTSHTGSSKGSDSLILEKVLETMDMPALKGRLVTSIDQVTATPANTRVIFLDDWILSGEQATRIFGHFVQDEKVHPYLERLEINLVAATEEMLEQGFTPLINDDSLFSESELAPIKQRIPVKACYRIQTSSLPRGYSYDHTPLHVRISGVHSIPVASFEDVHAMLPKPDPVTDQGSNTPGEVGTPVLALDNLLSYTRDYPLTTALYDQGSSKPDAQ